MEHRHEHEHDPRHGRTHADSHSQHGGAGPARDDAALARMLDLDADVLHAYLSEATAWVHAAAAGTAGRRVLDLGAGTGSGTVALAGLFGAAEVVAVDRSEAMLERVRSRAVGLGLAGRVRTVRADLDAGWPELGSERGPGPLDVVWASNALHEVADPDRVFRDVFGALRPGGLLAVAEMDAPTRFLPEGLGRPGGAQAGPQGSTRLPPVDPAPGLEERCHGALALAQTRAGRPSPLGPDWDPQLRRAGFAIEARRVFAVELTPPHPPSVGRYAHAYLSHIRPLLQDLLDGADLAALDVLLDERSPDGLLRRGDLVVRGKRTVWLARRP